jgi:5-methylcytosine-specific restriction endonuclease McrA
MANKKRKGNPTDYRKYRKRINADVRDRLTKAKYGSTMKPGLVTVKRLDGSEVGEVDQRTLGAQTGRRTAYAKDLDEWAREAGFKSYESYLSSSYWRDIRRRVLARDGHKCRCGRRSPLTIHHLRYEAIGVERLDDLQTMCWSCHRRLHGKRK